MDFFDNIRKELDERLELFYPNIGSPTGWSIPSIVVLVGGTADETTER